MAKIAVLVGIISMLMMQSVSGAKINNNQDHGENEVEEQAYKNAKLTVKGHANNLADRDWGRPVKMIHT